MNDELGRMRKEAIVAFLSILQSKNVKIRIYKTIILSVYLYGCETWSVTLREEHILFCLWFCMVVKLSL
jgi:hypothetical protein